MGPKPMAVLPRAISSRTRAAKILEEGLGARQEEPMDRGLRRGQEGAQHQGIRRLQEGLSSLQQGQGALQEVSGYVGAVATANGGLGMRGNARSLDGLLSPPFQEALCH